MEQTEQNLKWAAKKLSRFENWPGFPKHKEDAAIRTRLFCKMVQNKTAREIYSTRNPRWDPEVNPCGIGNDTNDVDWLLDTISEALESFPSHAAMRRIYEQYFTLDDGDMIQAARVVADGDTW